MIKIGRVRSENRVRNQKLVLMILNNIRYNVLGLFILFVNTSIYGMVNNLSTIDTIRISFTQTNGYAAYRTVVSYAYKYNAYQLEKIESPFPDGVKDLPNTINKDCVSKLLNDCVQYSSESQCDYINITKYDYADYIKILNNRDSLINYFPLLDFYPFSQDFKKEKYELEENDFLSLSCTEIINIIKSPHRLFLSNGLYFVKIELSSAKGDLIIIEPLWCFEGTAWRINYSGKEAYVGFGYIMSFLRDIQFDKYAFFCDKNILLFQIAESIVNQVINGDGSGEH